MVSKELGMSWKHYRKLCVRLTKAIGTVVEIFLSSDDLDSIIPSNVCAKAGLKYRKKFLNKLANGKQRSDDPRAIAMAKRFQEAYVAAIRDPTKSKINYNGLTMEKLVGNTCVCAAMILVVKT
jgi:hypothetical protein